MRMRIIQIENCSTTDKLLLFIDNGDGGEIQVKLIAWHNTKDEDSGDDNLYMQEVIIEFPNYIMAERFISDYTIITATTLVNQFDF